MDSLLSGIMEKLLLTSTGKVLRTAAGKILRFSQPDFTPIKYGLLYNWYAATDARKITSSDDWVVPSDNDWTTLDNYLGGLTISGGKLKETGLAYWNSPNPATNEVGFNIRGAAARNYNGDFTTYYFKNVNILRSSTVYSSIYTWNRSFFSSGTDETRGLSTHNIGSSIRLLYTGSGTPTVYVGNDGKIYPVVLIGTQRWIAMNLAETKYRDGSTIPNVTDNATWAALTTGACCAYNNDQNNV
jgi:uncharacterized protein (TIGR02145 family)